MYVHYIDIVCFLRCDTWEVFCLESKMFFPYWIQWVKFQFSFVCIAACLVDIVFRFSWYLSSFLSLDIFTSVFWSSGIQNSARVDQLMENLKSTVLTSRASGTSENYLPAFNKWRSFARDVLGTSEFPVRPIDCALYLQHLLELSKSVASINCAFYAFK